MLVKVKDGREQVAVERSYVFSSNAKVKTCCAYLKFRVHSSDCYQTHQKNIFESVLNCERCFDKNSKRPLKNFVALARRSRQFEVFNFVF